MPIDKNKPRILVISHVLPFPEISGQGMRVLYSLIALRFFFHVTFLTSKTDLEDSYYEGELRGKCDELLIMPTTYKKNGFYRLLIKFLGVVYSFFTGLKFSNFVINYFDYSPKRISDAIVGKKFDLVLFEYWHAYKSVQMFKSRNVPCILDMHNVLLQSYISHYNLFLPDFVKKLHINMYQKEEENSWRNFDAIIAINKSEYNYVSGKVPSGIKLFYMAMGIDLGRWPYLWNPVKPQRLCYYGGMGSHHNKQNALFCVNSIMPLIWEKYPGAEFWIVGNNPDNELLSLEKDSRIHVTGYQGNINEVLKYISVLLCPWHGKYGFRSRIIEVMATGVPVISSRDAVDGMELEEGNGLFFAENATEFAKLSIDLLNDEKLLTNQSLQAREQVENLYSFENTYQVGVEEIRNWLINR